MIKSKNLDADTIKERSLYTLKSLYTHNNFELKLNIKQLANWPVQKRRQIFRIILNDLIKSRFSYYHPYAKHLRTLGAYTWQLPIEIFQGALLSKFLKEVQDLEKNKRFSPEKVTTLQSVPSSLLLNDPEIFKYLLDNNILNLGKNFRFTAVNTNHIKENLLYLKGKLHSITMQDSQSIDEFIKNDINLDIMYHPDKLRLKLAFNMANNIKTFLSYIKKENRDYTNKELQTFMEILNICKHALNEITSSSIKIKKENLAYFEAGVSKKLGRPFKIELFESEVYNRIAAPITRDFRLLISDINQELIPSESDLSDLDLDVELFNPEETPLVANN
jgi:hypothetical protein